MESNVMKLTGKAGEMKQILEEVEKCAVYNELDKRSTLRLRLLAEEIVCMLPQLLEHSEGTFRMRNEGSLYEMHLSLKATGLLPVSREKLLGVSTSGKNIAATGILGRIREAADRLLMPEDSAVMSPAFYDDDIDAAYGGDMWTLHDYVEDVKTCMDAESKKERSDELEHSIVAKVADDVKVGVRGRHVEIILTKQL